MIGQELILILKRNKAFLTEDKPMLLSQLDLPPVAKIFSSSAFWKIKIINYSSKKIYVDVLSYHVGETQFPNSQKILYDKLNTIEKIAFKSIDTDGLFITLKGRKPGSFKPPKYEKVFRPETNFRSEIPPEKIPIKKYIKETFLISLKKVQFKDGSVQFIRKFKEYNKPLELSISNNVLKEEFEAVKNYFANVLNTKKIHVSVNIELIDHVIVSKTVRSPEIEKINQNTIEDVKLEFLKSTTKKKSLSENDKSIYTIDEYFDALAGDKAKTNIFYKDEKELFEDLLKITDTKHFHHLKYLSQIHAHQIMKLRFVYNPFSFIFLFEGNKNYHVIWETLDTEEATYIWHIMKDKQMLKQAVIKIEGIISTIKEEGKKEYINSTNDLFGRIYHDYSERIDGFLKWKNELNNVLV